MTTIKERLSALRRIMKEKNIDAVIVPTGDPHMSEYECDHHKCRQYITGFTGSDGTAVIVADENLVSGLWVDSRYFLQGEEQLKGSGIRLFKIGYEDTPPIPTHIMRQLLSADGEEAGDCSRTDLAGHHRTDLANHSRTEPRVACDGRKLNFDSFATWYDAFMDAGIEFVDDLDLVGEIWNDRPALPCNPVYEYDVKYAGKSRAEKLAEIEQKVAEQGAESFLLTRTDDISWLLNIRGSDIHCTPVPLCYLILNLNKGAGAADNLPHTLYINEDAVPTQLRQALAVDGIAVAPYDEILDGVSNLKADSVLLSTLDTNSCLYTNIPENVYIIEDANPTQLAKAVKNPVEIANTRKAHLKDGVAVTKFMYWLKSSVCSSSISDESGSIRLTEMAAAAKLHQLRTLQENFMGESFDSIIAYGDHAAIVHYQPTESTDKALEPKGMLLADVGAQYLEGTTDVTRTIALGPISHEERYMSTLVLKGHIALAGAVFPRGLNGANLDYLAHAPLWKVGKDYGHGTGHGVGHFLSVHEGPNNIHWTRNGAIGTTPAFEAGMITSCEPGYYEAGKFGIRHESLILCKPFRPVSGAANDQEQGAPHTSNLLCFEPLTLVPFDPDALDMSLLTAEEREWLKAYQQKVYEKIAPHLTDEEQQWLKGTLL